MCFIVVTNFNTDCNKFGRGYKYRVYSSCRLTRVVASGSVQEASLRDDQVEHMKSLQDDYLRCLKQQNTLTSQLAASTPVGGATVSEGVAQKLQ